MAGADRVQSISVKTPTHGRVLIADPAAASSGVVVIGFHGYAQSADNMLDELGRLPGAESRVNVSVQGLHRFYTRTDERVIASWMTRQDRDDAISDNVEYADRVLAHDDLQRRLDGASAVFVLGFSQGVAMAYRAALLGRRPGLTGIIAIGGDIPPDVKSIPADRWPRVFVAGGTDDHWFTPAKLAADESFLTTHGVSHQVLRYSGGHVFTDDLRASIAGVLSL